MADEKIELIVKEGRKFLHDISNKVLIGSGLGSHVLTALKKSKEIDEKLVDKLERSMNALNLMADMIREHRSYLISVLENNGPVTNVTPIKENPPENGGQNGNSGNGGLGATGT